MPYIRYSTKSNGKQYAALVNTVRKGKQVKQEYIENLGCVIDKQAGIFQSSKRGVFCYSIQEGFRDAPESYIASCSVEQRTEKLILDFGDSYFLNEYLKSKPYYSVYMELLPKQKDTLMSMLLYRILTDRKANCYADTWWQGNYASIVFPEADLKSQRISEFLQILGSEEVQRRFFELYINCLYGTCGTTGILIDSSGMPNASKMSLTQLSNHNGKINMEIRLIYVLDRKTGMPIYFRYCSGNIIDVTTLCTTIAELRQYKIAVDYAIMDAGYFSETNVKELYQSGIPFITRLAPNRKLFKKVVAENLDGLMIARYAVRYGNRLLYIKKVSITVYGNNGYAYIGIDVDSRNQQMKRTAFLSIDDKLSEEEADRRMLHLGLFMILSSVDIPVEEILPLYYTRQQIEQVFDIGKNDADLLPIRVQNEDTLRGHLLLTFMATVLLQNLQRDIISRRHKKDKINSEGILMNMRNQKCKAYKSEVIPQEPVKTVNEIYKLFKMKSPITIPC
jgi:transposase